MREQAGNAPPPQSQPYPGRSGEMAPEPRDEMRDYVGRELLDGKRALITGGDSGVGRAVAVAFAKEGADVAIAYLTEHEDANRTRKLVESTGRRCVLLPGDLGDRDHCAAVVEQAVTELGGLDVVVNNVAYHRPVRSLDELTDEQWEHAFAVNIHSCYRVTKAALPYLREGGAIVNTSSVNGLHGNGTLIDYAATMGAVNAFTCSMARNLADRGIRVNAVAPGPVRTPSIAVALPEERGAEFGEQVPMKRAADPDEIAPSYVFFAAERLSSYYTGEILAPGGGDGWRPSPASATA
ncbi:SDR family oxidoreductase [Nonomuraea sp. NPDC005983]|uniref:SDR family oxidoreductase n=1 Tax=Nonomuraea sp. NPDC005983 TaxID=3155595 RepID=UPI0033BB5020